MFDDLDNADYGEVFGSDDGFYALCSEFFSRAPEIGGVGQAGAEVFEEFGGVVIAGGFSGGDEDLH
jgi:hypothetical protein